MLLRIAVALFVLCGWTLASCPPNTFACRDGSCIPEDWVGDGEPDCDDRSDEDPLMTNKHNASSSSTSEDDPFDEIITQAPTQQPQRKHKQPRPSSTTEEPAAEEECPPEHQQRVDECSEPILMFLHEINDIYFENSSLLADSDMQHRVENGCNLMHEYTICVQGASEACVPDVGVAAWRDVEVYACQLVIPAAREYESCFGKGRDENCLVSFDQMASPFCRLVSSVAQDMHCVQRLHRPSSSHKDTFRIPKECSVDALEMLPPVLEESDHILETLRCPATPVIHDAAVTRPAKPMPTTAPEEVDADMTTEVTPLSEPATVAPEAIPTRPTEQPQEQEDEEEETDLPLVPETDPSIVDHNQTSTPMAVDPNAKELAIDMADAVNAFYYIYDICSSNYLKSPFKTVAMKICSRQDEIAKYSDCYQQTLEKEKCNIRKVKTECEALEAFNSNLDCAIVTMNDACEVEAQNLVIDIQEEINDIVIERKCFNADEEADKSDHPVADDGEFHLSAKLPKCQDEQENGALACLVELLEINKQLAQFQNLNFLLEIASPNSTIVSNICGLYEKYESCLHASVFKDGKRCSFASPLNTLARIGLSPICSLDSRPLLSSHRECLQRLALQTDQKSNCQSGLGNLGNTVNLMLQGIHGEALLCKSFYLIRETFSCGEKAVEEHCDAQALKDLQTLRNKMTTLGEEEGCPTVQPTDLDEIIARPVKRPSSMNIPDSGAPKARPLAPARPVAPVPPPPRATGPAPCAPEEQKKFETCVQPLTVFQPHPLSVIKMPRQIDEACEAFKTFKECSAEINCHPLWAKGMTAMFQYACGEGNTQYKEIRQCLRKTAHAEPVSSCVSAFSRGAPTQACLSANKLLSCSLATLQMECGVNASSWITDYVTKFATAIDSRCKLASQLPVGKIVGVGCSLEEEAIIDHCAAPLNDIGSRMEDLFQGGLQSMIKNINNLAPVFAGGCNLTEEFRTCASFLLSGRSPCVVSSCMIQAGDGICSQPDPAKAIDENLSCVFGQVQEPTFAKCIRTTISTVKTFTLSSFRNILPKFIDCTEELVKAKCGETPIKILRAMSSPDLCPVGSAPIVPTNMGGARNPVQIQPKIATCGAAERESYDKCVTPFYQKYRMLPVVLLNDVDNMDQVCADVLAMDECSLSTRMCASPEHMALKKMTQKICATRSAFDQHKICLKTVATSSMGSSCMSEFMSSSPSDKCTALNNAAKCMSKEVLSKCGEGALQFSFSAMADFAIMNDGVCVVESPSVNIETGCSEDDVVQFLDCESNLDQFSFRPISIIGDGSQFDSFCTTFSSKYKPCLESMKCKFEPVSTANMQLMDTVCNKPVMKKEQTSLGKCLSDYTNSPTGRACIEKMASVDPLSKDAPAQMCSTINDILSCASEEVETKCGYEALIHVYDLHIQWATAYNATCHIDSPEPKSVPTNGLDESRDSVPQVVVKDDTTPSAAPASTTEAPSSSTGHPKDITTVKASASLLLSTVFLASLLLL